MTKIKIYCELWSLSKDIKKIISENPRFKLVNFPFEWTTKKLSQNLKKPSGLTWEDNKYITMDSDIRFCDTERSKKYDEMKKVIWENNIQDINHVDTAYKEKCKIFITNDKDDIIRCRVALENITWIQFFYFKEIDKLKTTINSFQN